MTEDQPEPSPSSQEAALKLYEANIREALRLKVMFEKFANAADAGDGFLKLKENAYSFPRFSDDFLRMVEGSAPGIKPIFLISDGDTAPAPAPVIMNAEQIAEHLRAGFKEGGSLRDQNNSVSILERQKRVQGSQLKTICEGAHQAILGGIEGLGVNNYIAMCHALEKKYWTHQVEEEKPIIDKILDDAINCQTIAEKCDLLGLCKFSFKGAYRNYQDDKRSQLCDQIFSHFKSQLNDRDLEDKDVLEELSGICRKFGAEPADSEALREVYEWAADRGLVSFISKRPAGEVVPIYTILRPETLARVADYMLRNDMVYKYDQLVHEVGLAHEAGQRLLPYATDLDARRMKICESAVEGEIKRLRSRLAYGWEPVDTVVVDFRNEVRAHRSPGTDFLRTRLLSLMDQLLRQSGRTIRALQFATNPSVGGLLNACDLLDDARIQTIATRLEKGNDKNTAAWFAGYVERNHPQSAQHVAGIKMDVNSEEILRGLAPILSEGSNAAEKFQAILTTVPHEFAAAAQCDALDDVWDALAQADVDISHVVPYGREDIAMTRDSLRALSMDISRMMNVVQTQMPVIMSNDAYRRGTFLPSERSGLASLETDRTQISGSNIRINAETTAEGDVNSQITGFGFLVVQRSDLKAAHGKHLDEKRIFAIPVITVEDDIFETTMKNGGEDIFRHFQTIAGIFNHDYFHHMTARIINPYFSGLRSSISLKDTPFGVLMGKERNLPDMNPGKNAHSGMRGMEQFNRHYYQSYVTKNDWPTFAKNSADYEYHALHLHNVLYRRYMDDGPAGMKMRAALDGYMDGVRALGENLATQNVPQRDINRIKSYYANMMAFHLRRIVPVDHELMQRAEAHIDNLGIDKDYLHETLKARLDMLERNPAREKSVAEQSGVDPRAGDITAGQAARWHGVLSAVNVLNLLYKEQYAEAQEKALPALRQTLSIIARDIRTLDYRGGMDAYYVHVARRAGDNRKNQGPPMVRDLAQGSAAPSVPTIS